MMVRGGKGNNTMSSRTMQEMFDDYYKEHKCHLCRKVLNKNGYGLCTDCYIRAEFDVEELMWQGEQLTLGEYIEYKKLAIDLARC